MSLKQQKARKFYSQYKGVDLVADLKDRFIKNPNIFVFTLPRIGGYNGASLYKLFTPIYERANGTTFLEQFHIEDITDKVAYLLDESVHTDALAIPAEFNPSLVSRLSQLIYGDPSTIKSR